MGLISSISLDAINGPSDLATVLRLLLADSLDGRAFEIENPIYDRLNDRRSCFFRGSEDEVAFVFTPDIGGPILRVTVTDDEAPLAAAAPALSDDGVHLAAAWRITGLSLDDALLALSDIHAARVDTAVLVARFAVWREAGVPFSDRLAKREADALDDPGDGDDPHGEPAYGAATD